MMNPQGDFGRDTRHLQILLVLIVLVGAVAWFIRSKMIPLSYGQLGAYRAEALNEIAAQPSKLQSDATCLQCHEDVQEERADSPHVAVHCMHCHGIGQNHVAQARSAAKSRELVVSPAEEWDGDFATMIDLFITEDRATCLACHQEVVGMPETFRKINVKEHLGEQEAEDVGSANVCFECHSGHSPGL